MKTIEIESPNQVAEVAKWLVTQFGDHRVIALQGEMGSGKTKLIKEICREIGTNDNVSSPTFSIINEYAFCTATNGDAPIFHIDLYRLNDKEEALAIGIEDYISGENWCLVEWPELVSDLLPEDTILIKMEHAGDQQRNLTIHIPS